MINIWLIALAVLGILILFKFKEFRHRAAMIGVILLLLFLVASFGQLYTTNSLDLTSFDGIVNAGKVYFSWMGATVHNLGNVGGYAIKQDWGANITSVKENTKSAAKDIASKSKAR